MSKRRKRKRKRKLMDKKRDPVAFSMMLRAQRAGIHPNMKKEDNRRWCRGKEEGCTRVHPSFLASVEVRSPAEPAQTPS